MLGHERCVRPSIAQHSVHLSLCLVFPGGLGLTINWCRGILGSTSLLPPINSSNKDTTSLHFPLWSLLHLYTGGHNVCVGREGGDLTLWLLMGDAEGILPSSCTCSVCPTLTAGSWMSPASSSKYSVVSRNTGLQWPPGRRTPPRSRFPWGTPPDCRQDV